MVKVNKFDSELTNKINRVIDKFNESKIVKLVNTAILRLCGCRNNPEYGLCANCIYSCMNCKQEGGRFTLWERDKNRIKHSPFKAYYDRNIGAEIRSAGDIDRICKERGLVFGGDDLTREASRNKQHNEQNFSQQIQKELKERLLNG